MLARVVGPVAAYNAIVLLSFPLAAVAAYLLARFLLGSHEGALVAGLAYAFLPFHLAQASGHPHVAQTQWLPLYLLALWACLDRPEPRRVAFLLAAAAAVALSDFYAGFIAAVLSPVAVVAYGALAPAPPGESRWRRMAVTSLVLAVAGAAGLLLIHAAAPAVLATPGAFAFPRADLFAWSARWWSYLVPPVDHPLWGPWMRDFWTARGVGANALEHQQVGLSWALLALAAVPLWRWGRGDRGSPGVRVAPALAILGMFALVCSLSPERTIGPITVVRPSAALYALAPMFRAYARFGVVVGLMAALLAGGGVAWLWDRGAAMRRAAFFLLALAVLECAPFPPWRWRDVLPTRAHRWLAAQAGARPRDCRDEDCGAPALAESLRARGYTHVVLRPGRDADRWLLGHATSEAFARGPAFDDSAILEVRAAVPPAYVEALDGFFAREYAGDRSWRWMGRNGTLTVVSAERAADVVLEIELRAFPADRTLALLVEGRPAGAIDVTPEWRRYAVSLGTLPPGRTRIALASGAPAVIADGVLHNGDRRPLAVALAQWRIVRGGASTAAPGLY
jgi:hypothetical protein